MPDIHVSRVVDVVLTAPARRDGEPAGGAPGCQGGVRLSAPRRPADDDDRPRGAGEKCSRLLDVTRRRMHAGDRVGQRIGGARPADEHVLGQRKHDRARPARRRDVERARHELRDPVGIVDLRHPLRHRPEHVAVVDLLECLAPHHLAGHLADQKNQGRRVLIGGVHSARGVRRPRAASDHADPRPAGELSVGVGHVRGADLVAAGDELDRSIVERVQHGQIALAGNAEGQLDPVDDELVDEELAARPHVRRSRCSRYTVGFWSFGRSSSAGST